jgi:type III secretory pathway component EscT
MLCYQIVLHGDSFDPCGAVDRQRSYRLWQSFLWHIPINYPMIRVPEVKSVLLMMLLYIVRLTAGLSLVPVFAKQYIMGMGHDVAIFAMVLPLFQVIYPRVPMENLPLLILFVTIRKKVIIGVLLDYLMRFIFYATHSRGFIIDIQRRLSQALTFDCIAGSQTPLLGCFLIQMITMLFFTTSLFYFSSLQFIRHI